MSTPKTGVAYQLSRIAADLDSEKRTRADTNKSIIDELKGLRSDMQKNFHGDSENPGIFIRLDRIERNSFDEVTKRQDQHEKEDEDREARFQQHIMDMGGQISAIKTDIAVKHTAIQASAKTTRIIIGGIVVLMGLAVAILQLFV